MKLKKKIQDLTSFGTIFWRYLIGFDLDILINKIFIHLKIFYNLEEKISSKRYIFIFLLNNNDKIVNYKEISCVY